jgi:hypothetical protein
MDSLVGSFIIEFRWFFLENLISKRLLRLLSLS